MATNYYDKVTQQDLNTGVSQAVTKRNPAGGTLTAAQIGIHSFAISQLKTSTTWAPGTLATDQSAQKYVAVATADIGDFVLVSFDTMSTSQLILGATVSSAGVVTCTMHYTGSGTVAVPSGNLRVLVFKSA